MCTLYIFNLHVQCTCSIVLVVVFFYCSPIGEVFRSRLRQFPSLVNCCTIDWFSEWPDEALNSVAKSFMGDLPEVEDSGVSDGLIKSCVYIHQSVAEKSIQFLSELSRYNYVTPTSYLELLGTYAKLLKIKISEISNQRNRTKTGLDKVLFSYMYMYLLCTCTHVTVDAIVTAKCNVQYVYMCTFLHAYIVHSLWWCYFILLF